MQTDWRVAGGLAKRRRPRMFIFQQRRWKPLGKMLILISAAGLFILLRPAPAAHGIPAFARKYQTSCATCHNNFPELNDFGEAFKKNGFKFPKDDETFVKEPPVLLGAPATREAFPKAI